MHKALHCFIHLFLFSLFGYLEKLIEKVLLLLLVVVEVVVVLNQCLLW